jgi:hypothetical protein
LIYFLAHENLKKEEEERGTEFPVFLDTFPCGWK